MSVTQILTKGIGHTMLCEKKIQLLELHKNTNCTSRKFLTVYVYMSKYKMLYIHKKDNMKQ